MTIPGSPCNSSSRILFKSWSSPRILRATQFPFESHLWEEDHKVESKTSPGLHSEMGKGTFVYRSESPCGHDILYAKQAMVTSGAKAYLGKQGIRWILELSHASLCTSKLIVGTYELYSKCAGPTRIFTRARGINSAKVQRSRWPSL